MRTILVPFAPGLASESALDAALSLAKSMISHIRAVFVRPREYPPYAHNHDNARNYRPRSQPDGGRGKGPVRELALSQRDSGDADPQPPRQLLRQLV